MIADILPTKRKYAMTYGQLAEMTGASKRELRRAIRRERREGKPILSDTGENGGLWLWDGIDQNELKRFLKRIESVSKDLQDTIKPLKQMLQEGDGEQ